MSLPIPQNEASIIRDLAKQYMGLCQSDKNKASVELWRRHNSLGETRPPVLVCSFWHTAKEVDSILDIQCTHEYLRWLEIWLKRQLWQGMHIDDDTVFYPWFTMYSARRYPKGFWGYDLNTITDPLSGGYRTEPVIKSMDDLARLEATPHEVIDRNPENVQAVRDLIGDILPVHVVASTVYQPWGGTDLSEALGKLVGMQEFMVMMYDQPELIHSLMGFMRDAVLANILKGEADGDWTTVDGWSYAMNDTPDLPQPKANSYGAKLKDLWFFTHAQEFEGVGAEKHIEFLLQYQMPIIEQFGLVSYGCCETLDNKIDMLRSIPNLRSICIGPRSDVKRCAEQIGGDYIMSWRPSPAMITSFDPENCRQIIRKGFKDSQGCRIHMMLKEIMSLENDPLRLIDFAKVAREESMSYS